MFSRILIANRGEIAVRIIRTCRRLGIETVAVFSEADAHARHVSEADHAVAIGPSPAAQSYLNSERILAAAHATGAEAIHPGYGFLSENADFAEACARGGIAFIGPTPTQLRDFGLKHTARELARASGVPLLAGSGLVHSAGEAAEAAAAVGYPVMLKSSAGGGGIGLQRCDGPADLADKFATVARLGTANFGNPAIFVEKFIAAARHIEVQIFGDGNGHVVALGERDCSVQRRNQKVIEETPAPGISDETRQKLRAAAVALGQSVNYASAGTVEFIYDAATAAFSFLEVNTRLQVEHGITEEITGIDLVEWMIRQASGELDLSGGVPAASADAVPASHSIELRLYAEDPNKNFQPSTGLLTEVVFPPGVRVDSWIETGTEVTPFYDPLLAKIIANGRTRADAVANAQQALRETRIHGIETNQAYLAAIIADPTFASANVTTRFLDTFAFQPTTIDVLEPGTQTSIQDLPGRVGYWDVGVPPSGPMDDRHFRAANATAGNPPGTAALEITLAGPTLRFNHPATIALAGANLPATLDGLPVAYGTAIQVQPGQILRVGRVDGPGARTYLAVRSGFNVPDYLGSKSTFALGGFGGHAGRTLRTGDVLRLAEASADLDHPADTTRSPETPAFPSTPAKDPANDLGTLRVTIGPHAAPDFFTREDVDTIFTTAWEVHYNSNRTGVRLIGPKPTWARPDGGEAGLHPSNLHDNAYAIGAIDFTGDMPVLLGPDGPSLGGFVCPGVVIPADRWKIGQLKAGDTIRFALHPLPDQPLPPSAGQANPILHTEPGPPQLTIRQSGLDYLLVEFGENVLDLDLRFRAHALQTAVEARAIAGIIDLTPGIRSLQIHFDPAVLRQADLVSTLLTLNASLPPNDDLEIPSRIVHLPLSWDDPAVGETIEKYQQSVRADAPWCPSNLEFIRRINGLPNIDAVRSIIFDATYLVMGLGDVYLGAPVATPLDPRHRLVTTKYNPARTWTPPNVVGIGGAYLCIYGMEGPGGYQLFGRTLQVWNPFRSTPNFPPGRPWLLRFFDQIRFFPVSPAELTDARSKFLHGKYDLRIEPTTFKLRDYHQFLDSISTDTAACKGRQQAAFDSERERWAAAGFAPDESAPPPPQPADIAIPATAFHADSPVAGSLWKILVAPGDTVTADQPLAIVESMKMEIQICAPRAGLVHALLSTEGRVVSPGQHLVVMVPP